MFDFVRTWLYPAAVLAMWVTVVFLTLGQLIKVEQVLRSIPDPPWRQARSLGAAPVQRPR